MLAFQSTTKKIKKYLVVAVDFQGDNLPCCTHISSKWDLKMPDFFPLSFRRSWSHGWEDFCETPEFQITTEYIALDLMGKSENQYRSVNQVSECQAWAGIAVFTLGRIGCITNWAFSLFPLPSWLYGCLGVFYFNVFPWHLSFKKIRHTIFCIILWATELDGCQLTCILNLERRGDFKFIYLFFCLSR